MLYLHEEYILHDGAVGLQRRCTVMQSKTLCK